MADRLGKGQRTLLLALWAAVLVAPTMLLLSGQQPSLAVALAQQLSWWTSRIGWGCFALLALALLLLPPARAGLRLLGSNLRLSLASDRGPLLRAQSELAHLATAQRQFEVGRLAYLAREWELALVHLHHALELQPNYPAALHNYGLVLLRLGHVANAATTFAAAEQLEPGFAFGDALLHLARCEDLAGQHQAAINHFAQHRQLHGGGTKSQYWHAQALAAAGETVAAQAMFQQAATTPTRRDTPEEQWYRAWARMRSFGRRAP